jgi:hypothetical protein
MILKVMFYLKNEDTMWNNMIFVEKLRCMYLPSASTTSAQACNKQIDQVIHSY